MSSVVGFKFIWNMYLDDFCGSINSAMWPIFFNKMHKRKLECLRKAHHMYFHKKRGLTIQLDASKKKTLKKKNQKTKASYSIR